MLALVSSMRLTTALTAIALCLSGCGGRSTSNTPGAALSGEARGDEGWLVWWVAPTGAARTAWVDASGAAQAEREGIVIAAGSSLVRVEVEIERLVLPTCEQLEQGDASPPSGEPGERARLVAISLADGSRRSLLAPLESEGLASLRHEVTVTASLGPWLFVRERAETFGCGAHGNVDVVARVIDLRTGMPAELELDPTDELRARARDALIDESDGSLETPLELDAVEAVESVPVLASGRVGMEHVLATEACYACGDGVWSSYTRATRAREARVPAALAGDATFPAGVARWIAARDGVRGVSEAPAARLERFADQGGAADASARAAAVPGSASASR